MWAVGLVILIILVATVVIPQFKTTNTTGWSAGEIAMWGIGSLIVIAMVIISVTKMTR